VPAWQIPGPQNLRIRTTVNGVVKQVSSTAQMMAPIAAVIAAASRLTRLEPGDVILTGTPPAAGSRAANSSPRATRSSSRSSGWAACATRWWRLERRALTAAATGEVLVPVSVTP
jgi:2-keto-4-pentenoate hydratase/2-oxohepta-3-ene-1,7-dioic acid hydratase in catechol pathway